jgi:hypothetical protein
VVYSPAQGVTAERSGDRMVVLDVEGRVLSTLSPVGSLIWEALPAPVDSLLVRLRAEFPEVDPAVLETDARRFLDELCAAGLTVQRDAEG